MNSVHLKEGESVNANNWKTEFGSNEAAKEMVEHVGKQCSHFVTEEHYKKNESYLGTKLQQKRPTGFFSRASVWCGNLYRKERA